MQLIQTLFGPVFWLGLAVVIFWQARRVSRERKFFGMAIDRHWTGFWAWLIGGVLAAIVVSGLAILLGLFLPKAVWLWLSLLTAVFLLLSGLGYAPWFVPLAGLLAVLASRLHLQWFAAENAPAWTWHFLILTALLLAADALLLWVIDPPQDVPTIQAGRRGAKLAVYTRRQFYFLPLLLPVPGAMLKALPYWPQLGIGSAHFSLLFLPLILGAALTTKRQLPQTALVKWRKALAVSALLETVFAVAAFFLPDLALWWLIASALVGLGLGLWLAHTARLGAGWITQTSLGVRLVAVLPDTPAAKMQLEAGDIVLTCNDLPVTDADSLYEAIQTHPTFCRLKIQRLDGAVRLAETAIYAGVPHELGMITFAEDA